VDDLVSDFIAETREGLEALDSELVRFEQRPDDPQTLGGIFRLVHTIKGTCGFLGLGRLQAVAHAAENLLGAFRDGELAVTQDAVSAILETVDAIRGMTEGIAATGVEPTGDDSALIGRLEAIMQAGQRPPQEPGEVMSTPSETPPEAPAPAPPALEAQTHAKPLIDRLGGDATIDVAVEMALPQIAADPRLEGADPDRLHGALRDSLALLARGGAGADFGRAFGEAGADLAFVASGFERIGVALGQLDIEAEAIQALQALAVRAMAATGAAEAVSAPEPEPEPEPEPGPAPVAELEPTPAPPSPAGASVVQAAPDAVAQTIRVSVDALEHLMTVVSELVLIRNQLIQTLRLEPESPFAAPLNRLNQVTSELQEGVMTTRMQPISGAWAKLPRLVRDLSQELGKKIELSMSGQETELDRQVLELIRDPLTHMIRNAADHGLETPAARRAAGKRETGSIMLQARHEGGAIVIEVADDGAGLSSERIRQKAVTSGLISAVQAEQMTDADARQLIFLPGFSTASQVTSVSGRGVGMDVVRTNIEKIGGAIDVSSVEGQGSRFVIRIPLTLTIVSALIVECCGERFALPQSSVVELVSASGASGRAIEQIEGAAVLRLRDRLLPLVSLQQLLQLEATAEPSGETCIVVARVGAFAFGVIVDRVFDTEEIVVKPVATVLRHLKLYSGATILGDGSVILILDPKGISVEAGAGHGAGPQAAEADAERSDRLAREALLVFEAGNGSLKAARLAAVSRIEELAPDQLERVDGRSVIQYRGRLMPVVDVEGRPVEPWAGGGRRPLLVFTREERAVGLLVEEIVDIVESEARTDLGSHGGGALGSLIIAERATELVNVEYYWRRAVADEASPAPARREAAAAPPAPEPPEAARGELPRQRLLMIDSSPFSRLLLAPLLTRAGYDVSIAQDAAAALARHDGGERFHLIMADISGDSRALATALHRADGWRETPLLSLGLASGRLGDVENSTLIAAVEAAMQPVRGAA
jgi:two-component system chemotaxis sensor kinase CheA